MQKFAIERSILVAALFISSSASAFICPKSYTQIRPGMSMDQVRQACGAPTKALKKDAVRYTSEKVEFWSYRKKTPVGYSGDIRPSMSYSVKQGKVASISVGGQTMDSSNACGSVVRVGDSAGVLSGACGYPSSTQHGTSRKGGDYVKEAVWVYKFDQYRPAVSLTFQNGVLTSIAK